MTNKVAILYIAIGKYINFWPGFYNSFDERFLTNSHKEYFVFTDAQCVPFENEDSNIHRIHQEDLGWPGDTLYRFDMFLKVEDYLKSFDYCFFMNANLVCQEVITEEEFLPRKDQLLVVKHPWYNWTDRSLLPYERDKRSAAYIPLFSKKAQHYFCGGVNGGGVEPALEMYHTLSERIRSDEEKGIIAIWNDESHLNKYMSEQDDYKYLDSSYAYPEDEDFPFPVRILILKKRNYIELSDSKKNATHSAEAKQRKNVPLLLRIIVRARNTAYYLKSKLFNQL